MGFRDLFRRRPQESVEEAAPRALAAPNLPPRLGFEYGIDQGGLTEYSNGMGASTESDRRSQLQQLYEAYLACTWAWAAVNAIARTVTAGGLVSDWDNDDGEGDEETPEKPPAVLALERLLAYCNPREDIRQLMRGVITDLLVFGDAFLEVSWLGNQPVALYSLDSPTTQPLADQHGVITGYVQITEYGQRAEFEPRQVIHISFDSPRSGVFGVSPTQAALLPITTWLFTAACLKETYRKGNPRDLHVDHPRDLSTTDMNRWTNQYMIRNVGPRNIGRPVITKGGATVKELSQSRIAEMLETLNQKRDEILANYGVPPAEAGVIESGNIGGGTGESQRKTFLVNTCGPIAELVLEKINFHLGVQGFGVQGWHQKFAEVDMRDSKTIEDIRDMRIRSGQYTLNKGRAEIGEPPVDGGDTAILALQREIVRWRDMDAYSKAGIALRLKGTALEPGDPGGEDDPVTLIKTPPPPAAPEAALAAVPPVGDLPADGEPPAASDKQGAAGAPTRPAETGDPRRVEYRRRLAEALRDLPVAG